MNLRSRFKIIVEEESTLERKIQASASILRLALLAAAVVLLAMAAGALVLFFSPARHLLPGYLKESERTATEVQHMRIDSLQNAFQKNVKFLENIMAVMDPSPAIRDSVPPFPVEQSDTLLATSSEEARFVALIRERDKFNVSVIAPLAAESMMFSHVNDDAIFASDSKREKKPSIILARGATVSAIADGKIISVSQSLREGGGYAVIIQHPKGFLSRLSRLGTVLVEPGDEISGGQIIAVQNNGNARNEEKIYVELWHNGTSLVPYDYLGDSPIPAGLSYDADISSR